MDANNNFQKKNNKLIFEQHCSIEYDLFIENLIEHILGNSNHDVYSPKERGGVDVIIFKKKTVITVDDESTNRSKFVDLVWNQYKDKIEDYPKFEYEMCRIREMLLIHNSFNKLSAQNQYDLAVTIYLMITHSLQKHLNENMPLSFPKDEKYKYAPSEFYVPPKIIEL